MTRYSTFVLSVLIFAAAYAIGARTFHPAVLVEYMALQPEIIKCQAQQGNLIVQDNTAVCTKVLFTITLNNSYFESK